MSVSPFSAGWSIPTPQSLHEVRIFLHHSSVPYSAAGPAPVTEAEVLDVQQRWAAAIKNISKVPSMTSHSEWPAGFLPNCLTKTYYFSFFS